MEPRPDLHESDRTGLGFVGQDELQRRFRVFFDQSARVTIGKETADGALERFASAVHNVLAATRGQDAAIMTHGTVLSLAARHKRRRTLRTLGISRFALLR